MNPSTRFELESAPGHLIRRAHQLAMAQFASACSGFDITPVQFAALTAVQAQDGIDQARLAQTLALDAVTVGSVLQRLEAKTLIVRRVDARDKRCKQVFIQAEGKKLLHAVTPLVEQGEAQILAPLSAAQAKQLMTLLKRLVTHSEA